MKKQIILVTLILLGIGMTSLVNAAYIFTDLGTLGGSNSAATGINNAGQIVGYSQSADSASHNIVWNGSTTTDFGTNGSLYAINNNGQVVGYSFSAIRGYEQTASVWNGTTPTYLGTLGGALAINSSGQIAGYSYTASGVLQATVWSGSSGLGLSTPIGSRSAATGINNSGQVAGFTIDENSGWMNATRWDGGLITTLNSLGGSSSEARAINNAGLIVGRSNTGSAYHAAIWDSITPTDLATLGGNNRAAYAINSSGQVVGYSDTGNGDMHATLWNDGVALDLNSFLDVASMSANWILTAATGINDNGWIVGTAQNYSTAQQHAFLLSLAPIPEPATYTVLLAGLSLLCFTTHRRKLNQV